MDKERLALELGCEFDHLRTLAEQAEALAGVPEVERRPWDAAAAAKYVSDLWLGFENLCKRRYAYLRLAVPTGPDSHSRILADFLAEPQLGGGLKPETARNLKKYLAFRHRFMHGYGYEVDWSMLEEPLRLLPSTVKTLISLWQAWLVEVE